MFNTQVGAVFYAKPFFYLWDAMIEDTRLEAKVLESYASDIYEGMG